jgi:hypothetical protein
MVLGFTYLLLDLSNFCIKTKKKYFSFTSEADTEWQEL